MSRTRTGRAVGIVLNVPFSFAGHCMAFAQNEIDIPRGALPTNIVKDTEGRERA